MQCIVPLPSKQLALIGAVSVYDPERNGVSLNKNQ